MKRIFLWMILFVIFLGNAYGVEGTKKFPTKPIKVIVPSAAGGTNDQVVRMVAPVLSKYLGVPVIIENIPGAGGVIAYSKFAKEKADGYSLLSFNFISPVVFEVIRKTDYVTKDYSIVAGWNVKNFILAVHMEGPKTFPEFVELARQKSLSVAVTGGSTDIQMYAMEDALDIKLKGIRYRSGNECVVAVAGKHVDAVMTFGVQLLPLIRAGKIRPLAVFSATPDPFLQGVPTVRELGYGTIPCLPVVNGFAAPPRTPQKIITFLEGTIKKVITDPQSQSISEKLAVGVKFYPKEEVNKLITDYYGIVNKYKQLITE